MNHQNLSVIWNTAMTFIRIIIAASGLGILIISVIAIVGHYVADAEFYTWYAQASNDAAAGMSLPTAVCFLLTSLTMVAVAMHPTFWSYPLRNGRN